MIVAALSLAGSAGAVVRFLVDGALRARSQTELPVGTLLVNVSGSLLLGVIVGLVQYHGAPADLQTIGGVGFCGGYTTFSAATFETVRLAQQGHTRAATVHAAGTLALCAAAAACGLGAASL